VPEILIPLLYNDMDSKISENVAWLYLLYQR
jgi:hypothetical protein